MWFAWHVGLHNKNNSDGDNHVCCCESCVASMNNPSVDEQVTGINLSTNQLATKFGNITTNLILNYKSRRLDREGLTTISKPFFIMKFMKN